MKVFNLSKGGGGWHYGQPHSRYQLKVELCLNIISHQSCRHQHLFPIWIICYVITLPLIRMFHRFLILEDLHRNCLKVCFQGVLNAIDQLIFISSSKTLLSVLTVPTDVAKHVTLQELFQWKRPNQKEIEMLWFQFFSFIWAKLGSALA